MDYFFTPQEMIEREHLTITGDEFNHLTHVMRKQVGDEFCVVDGRGNCYRVTLKEVRKHIAYCLINERRSGAGEPAVRCVLGVAVLKNGARFDFLVEKAAELGVSEIFPLTSERTIPEHARTERWRKIALAAMKQSERSVLPGIGELTPFTSFVGSADTSSLRLLPHPGAATDMKDCISDTRPGSTVFACIGPEGGFTEDEVSFAAEHGFKVVALGPRPLRTETAAIVMAFSLLGGRK